MRFERSTLIGSVLLLTVPLFALLHSIGTLRAGKKNTVAYLLIALCFFFFFIKIPPLADLYRHFANYDAINSATSLGDVIAGQGGRGAVRQLLYFQNPGYPFLRHSGAVRWPVGLLLSRRA